MIYLRMPNGAEYNIENGNVPDLPPPNCIHTTESIANIVSEYYQVSIEDMQAKTRKREKTEARQIAMYLAKKFTKDSLKTIGNFFGGRDHTTVIHSRQIVKDLMDTDPIYRHNVLRLKNLIN